MSKINVFETGEPDYAITYTAEELRDYLIEISGDVYDTEYEFGYDTVRIKRTRNPFRRLWGGLCAEIAGWAIRQNEKHGDYYMLIDDEYNSKKIIDLEKILDADED